MIRNVIVVATAIGLAGCSVMPFGKGCPCTAGEARTESFFVDLPNHGIAVTHSGTMMLGAGPPGIPLLEEPAVRNGLAILLKLRDANGEVIGFASELEVFPEGANIIEDDVVWDTDWTLVVPGRGTLFLHQQEHSGELGPKVVGPTFASGEPWVGDWTVTSTVGPREDGRGVVAGGSGEFTGARGSFTETIRLTRFTKEGAMFGTLELKVWLDGRP